MKELQGLRVRAVDGDVAKIKDFCFDDRSWAVRYLVVDVGTWLQRRRILISPVQGVKVMSEGTKNLTVTTPVLNGPSIETDKPVSLQFKAEFYEHSSWPIYRQDRWLCGPIPRHGPFKYRLSERSDASPLPESGDAHLRSANEVCHYLIQALDNKIGHLEDFIIEDEEWAIRYLVVNTRNWWLGKRVLLPPLWISWFSWPESRIYVDLDRETIRRAPEYDPSIPMTREYETSLFDYYSSKPYWV